MDIDKIRENEVSVNAENTESLLRESADKGDIYSAYRLAQTLLDGGRPMEDRVEGQKWLLFAAENGNLDAIHTLAVCYNTGDLGFPEDREQHFKWLKAECENDEYPMAWFLLANAYEDGDGTQKNNEQAFFWYKKAADAGQEGACQRMPELYARGIGTKPDPDKARAYLDGLREMGICDEEYLNNIEFLLPEWEREARIAADPNDMDAQKEYAVSILGTDAETAISILERCGETGHIASHIFLYEIFSKGFPKDGSIISADQSRANYWLEKSAACDGTWAYKRLSSNYQSGVNGYQKNAEKAFYWIERALKKDANDANAQVLVGIHYLDGDGVERDMERGIELVRSSAQAGLGYGQYIYGRLHHFGGGSIQKDLKQAEYWMQKAIENGWKDADRELEEIRQELAEKNISERSKKSSKKIDKKSSKKSGKSKGIVPLVFCILVFLLTVILSDVEQRVMIFASAPVFLWTLITRLARRTGTKKLNIGLLLSGIAVAISLIGIISY